PDQFAFAKPATQPPREQQALFPEVLDYRRTRAGALIGGEQGPQRVLHLAIRIQDDPALGVVDQADRQRRLEFSPPRLVQDATAEPRPQDVQLGLRDRPLGTWNTMHKLQITGHPGGGRLFASSRMGAKWGPGSGWCVMASGKEKSHGS